MKIGILGLQGDFARHEEMIRVLGYDCEIVRYPEQFRTIAGLIIPGGESTTMSKLLRRMYMIEPLRELVRTKPILGTCAGIILMSKTSTGTDVFTLGALDITVERNAYGRQVHSFSELIDMAMDGVPALRGTFIRAPKITRTGRNVQVLATRKGEPVAVQDGMHIGLTFHPELDGEAWFHNRFIEHCRQQKETQKTDAA